MIISVLLWLFLAMSRIVCSVWLCYFLVIPTYFFLVLKNEHAYSIKLCDSVEYDRITDVLTRPMTLERMSQMRVTDHRQQ